MKKVNASILIILILFFALVGFYLIYVNNPSMSGEQSFFNNLINSLMGAMVVALVTASIFIFQSRIEGDKEKEKYIYQKKLELYQNLARTISRINNVKNVTEESNVKNVTEESLNELRSFGLEIDLLADKDLLVKYNKFIDFINSDSFKTANSDSFKDFTIDIISLSRTELDVIQSVPLQKRSQTEQVIKNQKRNRSSEYKFELLEAYCIGELETKDLEEKFKIGNVHSRVRGFRKELVKYPQWKEKLDEIGIPTDLGVPLSKGCLKKRN